MSILRRMVRLFAFPIALVILAAWIDLTARVRPAAERPGIRARGQRTACRLLCRILGVRVTVADASEGRKGRLVVSNHLGALDGFSLASSMPVSFVAKAEMASWPVMGWVCRTVGVIFVDRGRRVDAGRMVAQVRQRLNSGVPVLVFPEGTVGDGQVLLPFKTGAFEVAVGAQDIEIVPVFLTSPRAGGLRGPEAHAAIVWHRGESLAQHVWRLLGMRRVDIQLRYGAPIDAEGRDRRSLLDASRTEMERVGGDVLLAR